MLTHWRWWVYPLAAISAMGLIGVLLIGFAALVTIPTLPSLEALTDYRPKIPLRVYSAEGVLIGEFGEERRRVVKISAAPERLKQAIVAAEDDRFYHHGGVDYLGILRAPIPISLPAAYGKVQAPLRCRLRGISSSPRKRR